LAGTVLGLLGCVSLTPFSEIQRVVGKENFVSAAGHAVHVEQEGSGSPLVLLHGFGGSTLSWRRVIPELASTHRVVALDQFGFGWTERPTDPALYGSGGQLALVVAVMDALGLERAVVMGHSWGGGLALRLAAAHPERISKLILVAATDPRRSGGRRAGRMRQLLARAALRTVLLREGTIRSHLQRSVYDPEVVDEDMVRGYLARLRVEGAGRALSGLSALPATTPPPVVLEHLDLPVLLVWGAEDRAVPPAVGERLEAAIPGARRVILERCGHLPMDEAPEEFLTVVRPFLAEGEWVEEENSLVALPSLFGGVSAAR
jgi:pimeloyl-ACP methyl ester carboxylesterase